MAVNFYLSPRSDKKGENPIRVSIAIKGTRLISTAGFSVRPESWDNESQSVKPKATNSKNESAKDINAHLKQIDGYFSVYETKVDHKPTTEELGDVLAKVKGSTRKRTKKEDTKEIKLSVLDYFDRFIKTESRANEWEDGTLECWSAFRRHLKNMGDIDFDFFNDAGIKKFVNYLRGSDDSLDKKEMEEKTVKKHFSNLRWFLKWCINNGICKADQISNHTPKFKVVEKPVIFLTKDELIKLYNYEIPANGTKVVLHNENGEEYEKIVSCSPSLAKTRDIFCFCAFTSLRYSDAVKLKKIDVIGDKINVTTKKTHDRLSIDLNGMAKNILDKYKDEEIPFGLALPIISNQKMNDYIKDLGELCEFTEPITKVCYRGGKRIEETFRKWELLSTHAGRRTFICYALSIGIPPQVVMKWTGHSDYKAMRPYIEIAEQTKASAMKLFDQSFE
jgi:integrase